MVNDGLCPENRRLRTGARTNLKCCQALDIRQAIEQAVHAPEQCTTASAAKGSGSSHEAAWRGGSTVASGRGTVAKMSGCVFNGHYKDLFFIYPVDPLASEKLHPDARRVLHPVALRCCWAWRHA
jgi:hypothetical protein